MEWEILYTEYSGREDDIRKIGQRQRKHVGNYYGDHSIDKYNRRNAEDEFSHIIATLDYDLYI